MLSSIAALLRLASLVSCLVVVASFAIFAVDQTGGASAVQQKQVNGEPGPATSRHESSLHEAIDEASNKLTAPFSGVTSGSSSEWVVRGVNVLLALIVYGFGLGFLARALRMRA